LTGVPDAFVPGRNCDSPAVEAALPLALPETVALELVELLLPELLLLQAAAPTIVTEASRAGAPRRSARPVKLPCFDEVMSCLAGQAGGRAARGCSTAWPSHGEVIVI
jgi:hypothetical protein